MPVIKEIFEFEFPEIFENKCIFETLDLKTGNLIGCMIYDYLNKNHPEFKINK